MCTNQINLPRTVTMMQQVSHSPTKEYRLLLIQAPMSTRHQQYGVIHSAQCRRTIPLHCTMKNQYSLMTVFFLWDVNQLPCLNSMTVYPCAQRIHSMLAMDCVLNEMLF